MVLRRAAFLSLILLVFAGCDGLNGVDGDSHDQEAQADFSYALDASGVSSFQLSNITGEVHITGVAGLDSIRVTGVRRSKASTLAEAEANLPLVTVVVQQLATTVSVQTNYPSDASDLDFSVDYECEVPPDLAISVMNMVGAVTGETLENAFHGSVLTGNVVLTDITGDVLLSVVTGSVEGWITVPAEGSCVLSVVTGGIDVQLLTFPPGSVCSMEVVTGLLHLGIPVATSATFSGTVVTGSISLNNLTLQDPVITPSATSGQLGDGGATITVSVITGSIQVVGATNLLPGN